MNDDEIHHSPGAGKASPLANLSKKDIGRAVASHKARIARAIDLADASLIEQAVLRAIVSMVWARNRDPAAILRIRPRVAVYPGKKRLAWSANVCESSVGRALKKWRDLGCIQAVSYVKGGRNATRYQLVDSAILGLKNRHFPGSETGSKPGLNRVKTGSKPGHCDPRHSLEIEPTIQLVCVDGKRLKNEACDE